MENGENPSESELLFDRASDLNSGEKLKGKPENYNNFNQKEKKLQIDGSTKSENSEIVPSLDQ